MGRLFSTGIQSEHMAHPQRLSGVRGQTDPATAYTDEDFLQGFDWERSRAYALGLSSVYLNLKGREGYGMVSQAEAPACSRRFAKNF